MRISVFLVRYEFAATCVRLSYWYGSFGQAHRVHLSRRMYTPDAGRKCVVDTFEVIGMEIGTLWAFACACLQQVRFCATIYGVVRRNYIRRKICFLFERIFPARPTEVGSSSSYGCICTTLYMCIMCILRTHRCARPFIFMCAQFYTRVLPVQVRSRHLAFD